MVAYPAPAVGRAALTAADTRVTAAGTAAGAQCLIDGDPATELLFDGSPEAVIDLVTDADLDLRNITVWPARRPIRAEAELQVKGADGYRTVASFGIDRSNPNIEVGFDPYAPVSVSVAKTTGREFRLIVRGAGKDTGLGEVLLSSLPRVERYAEKTFAKMFQSPLPYWEEYQWRDQPVLDAESLAVDPAEVVDITECLDGDRLVWEAPAGEWVVMRTGMRPTGIRNSPAAPEGTGLEVDKMTPAYLQHHFDAFIGEILRRIPAEDRRTFRVVVADSYEKGGQNFTDTFLTDFRERYGYDALPFLPVYDGVVVGSQDISDRFLWDMRRLAADKLAYAHIGGAAAKSQPQIRADVVAGELRPLGLPRRVPAVRRPVGRGRGRILGRRVAGRHREPCRLVVRPHLRQAESVGRVVHLGRERFRALSGDGEAAR